MDHELASTHALIGATVKDIIRGFSGDLAIVTDRGFIILHARTEPSSLRIVAAIKLDTLTERGFGDQETARLREAVAKVLSTGV